MQTKVSAKNMEVTPAIEDYAQKKVEKFLRYFDRIQQIDVIIAKGKNDYTVEIITDVEHHAPFIATMTAEDLYACIDMAVDRASRQLRDHKSRVRDDKHH